MTRTQADNWSLARSLAFLAASFAIVFGSLVPFGAYAANPSQPIVLCTAEGPQTIHAGGFDGPVSRDVGARCAACLVSALAVLPQPPVAVSASVPGLSVAQTMAPVMASIPPPARAPPRPPSTAPPRA